MNNNPNTLRMGQHQLHKLLEQIDQAQTKVTHPDREFVRWPYRLSSVELIIEHSAGIKTSIFVATRNISRGGICILHCAYIHPNANCEIKLRLDSGQSQLVPGKIIRCTHAGGRVHEVGIEFNSQISTKNLLGLDPLNEAYSLESVEPDRLQGTVLAVTQTEIERDILLMLLEDTKLVLNTANNTENAITIASKGCDLIIIDLHIGSESGPDLVRSLRQAGSDVPVIIMTSDKSETTLDMIRDAQASGILSKPISKDRLYQALAEFLHADGDGGPLLTTLSESDITFPLLVKFYDEIKVTAHDLETALRSQNHPECLQLCRTLCGTASPLGFGSLSDLALVAEQAMVKSGSLKGAVPDIRALIAICRRIKTDPSTLLAIKRAEAERLQAIEDAKQMRPLY